MALPWFPFNVGDYRRDTAHLGALEHGAYFLLICHYWQCGGLPDDDRQLARIAACTASEWKRVKPIVACFFSPNWKSHKRIDAELAKAADISSKRRAAADRRHNKADANGHAIADQMQVQMDTHLTSTLTTTQIKKEFNNGALCEALKLRHPRHGAKSKDGRFVYLKRGTTEFDAYSQDHVNVIGSEPEATSDGRWFPLLGAK